MICTVSLYTCQPRAVNITINLPNNQFTVATLIGDVQLTDDLALKNVLYVPSFQYILLSISNLTKRSYCHVLFSADKCLLFSIKQVILQDNISFKEIGHAKQHNGLYHLNLATQDTAYDSTLSNFNNMTSTGLVLCLMFLIKMFM